MEPKQKNKLRTLILQVYNRKSNNIKQSQFIVANQFPEIIPVLESLLTNDYGLFVKDIQWLAPRPSTFRIILNNGQMFNLIYGDRSWIASVEGKRYYLGDLGDEERATEAISRILMYSSQGITEDIPLDTPKELTKAKPNAPTQEENNEDLNEVPFPEETE